MIPGQTPTRSLAISTPCSPAIDPRDLQVVEAGSGAKLTLVVGVAGEDAVRLERLAAARGKKPSGVVAELLRDADRPAA